MSRNPAPAAGTARQFPVREEEELFDKWTSVLAHLIYGEDRGVATGDGIENSCIFSRVFVPCHHMENGSIRHCSLILRHVVLNLRGEGKETNFERWEVRERDSLQGRKELCR